MEGINFMGSDPITKFLRQRNSRVETPGCLLTMLFLWIRRALRIQHDGGVEDAVTPLEAGVAVVALGDVADRDSADAVALVLRGDELAVVPDRLPAAGVVDRDGEAGVAVLLHDHANGLVGTDICGSGDTGARINCRVRSGGGACLGDGTARLGDGSAGIGPGRSSARQSATAQLGLAGVDGVLEEVSEEDTEDRVRDQKMLRELHTGGEANPGGFRMPRVVRDDRVHGRIVAVGLRRRILVLRVVLGEVGLNPMEIIPVRHVLKHHAMVAEIVAGTPALHEARLQHLKLLRLNAQEILHGLVSLTRDDLLLQILHKEDQQMAQHEHTEQ